ncbi:hypothetical protein H6G00_01830 [Leptolyngbya sp. FACHB-541]|uniref:hypothetical protein n=1 Tax=Leptolyngbya sp. FACHB-541 TaxID=2692810 RepID=UPI001682108B|nr:hypothetical protein [Leptolyngbya sp. FACHB-541]MBD1995371.1 hypothetical protein [Leptolyngbya sp. FACHB-541]
MTWFKLDGIITHKDKGAVWKDSLIVQAATEAAAREKAIAQMMQREPSWDEDFEEAKIASCTPLQSRLMSCDVGLEELVTITIDAPVVEGEIHLASAKERLLEIAPALLRQFIGETDDLTLRRGVWFEADPDAAAEAPSTVQIFHLPGLSITHEDVWDAGYDFYGLSHEQMQAIAQQAAERIDPRFMKELIERACTELKIPERDYIGNIGTDRYWLVYEATSVALGVHSFELKVVHIPTGKARNATWMLIKLFLQQQEDQPGQLVDELWRFPSPQVHRWMRYFKEIDSYALSRLEETMDKDLGVNPRLWQPIGDDQDLLVLYQDSNGHRSDR